MPGAGHLNLHDTPAAVAVQQPVLNRTYTDANGNLNLVGASTRARLSEPPFADWFDKNYADYTIDTVTANRLKPLLKDKQFLIFMGTWCGDSRREVPRLYKLLAYCGVNEQQIRLVNVSNRDSVYKQSPDHEERGLYIFRVPDLLVYDRQREIGRIVESPVKTVEQDLLAIVEQHNYVPRYPGMAHLIGLFQTQWKPTAASYEQAAAQLRPLVRHWGELASLGRVLLAGGDTDRAIDALRIGTILFPEEPAAFHELATAYVKKGNKQAARECCEIVLQLQPGHMQAMTLLEQLYKQ